MTTPREGEQSSPSASEIIGVPENPQDAYVYLTYLAYQNQQVVEQHSGQYDAAIARGDVLQARRIDSLLQHETALRDTALNAQQDFLLKILRVGGELPTVDLNVLAADAAVTAQREKKKEKPHQKHQPKSKRQKGQTASSDVWPTLSVLALAGNQATAELADLDVEAAELNGNDSEAGQTTVEPAFPAEAPITVKDTDPTKGDLYPDRQRQPKHSGDHQPTGGKKHSDQSKHGKSDKPSRKSQEESSWDPEPWSRQEVRHQARAATRGDNDRDSSLKPPKKRDIPPYVRRDLLSYLTGDHGKDFEPAEHFSRTDLQRTYLYAIDAHLLKPSSQERFLRLKLFKQHKH